MSPHRILVLCGNPRPASRTLAAAQGLAGRIAAGVGGEVDSVDLALLGPAVLTQPAPADLATALEQTAAADVVVVATPVYKASLTGLLKAFLDRLPPAALRGVLAVPMTVAGAPQHHLVADLHLRPVLLELGASTPTAAFPLVESQLPQLDEVVESWWQLHGPALSAGLTARERITS